MVRGRMGSLAVRAVADARDLPEPAVGGSDPRPANARPARGRLPLEIHGDSPGIGHGAPAAVDRAATRPALVQTLVSGKTN